MAVHAEDVGILIVVVAKDAAGAVINISAAEQLLIKLKQPGMPAVEKAATLLTDGTDGKMKYLTVAGDLPSPGLWKVQGYVVLDSAREVARHETRLEH
jgi:hypothetical protein